MKETRAIASTLAAPTTGLAALATLVSVRGSSYRRPGARLLVTADHRRLGSISGGCLEEDVMARAARVLASGVAELAEYDTTSENDLVWGVGLGCHGVVQVLIERVAPCPAWALALAANLAERRPTNLEVVYAGEDRSLWGTRIANGPARGADRASGIFRQTIAAPHSLLVFGAGDDAFPLVRFAKELGWHVTVADPRPEFAHSARFPDADALVVAPADRLVDQVAPNPESLVVVMTHHYVFDVPILRTLLPRPLAYLGLLGPKRRAERILADLAAGGWPVPADSPSSLHAPIGLDLGADSPTEVALAIVAEMLAVLSGRDARPLRERTKPIHDEEVFAQRKP